MRSLTEPRIQSSWEFVKFITSKESQIYWASQVYDTVANIEASQDPSLMEIPVFKMALEAMLLQLSLRTD